LVVSYRVLIRFKRLVPGPVDVPCLIRFSRTIVNTVRMSKQCPSYLDEAFLRSLRLEATSSKLAAASGLSGKQDIDVFPQGVETGAC
jgi:hypothetical protein